MTSAAVRRMEEFATNAMRRTPKPRARESMDCATSAQAASYPDTLRRSTSTESGKGPALRKGKSASSAIRRVTNPAPSTQSTRSRTSMARPEGRSVKWRSGFRKGRVRSLGGGGRTDFESTVTHAGPQSDSLSEAVSGESEGEGASSLHFPGPDAPHAIGSDAGGSMPEHGGPRISVRAQKKTAVPEPGTAIVRGGARSGLSRRCRCPCRRPYPNHRRGSSRLGRCRSARRCTRRRCR